MNDEPRKHFGAFCEKDSKVLILGSFPSKSSLDANFFYQNCANRFWCVMGKVFGEKGLVGDIDAQKTFLTKHHIALYDIWELCYKENQDSASDDDIVASKSQKVDLSELLQATKIQKIFTTIGGSEKSQDKRGGHFKKWGVESWLWDNYSKFMPHCKSPSQMVVPLYSTSNASGRAGINDEILLDDYKQIKEILHKG